MFWAVLVLGCGATPIRPPTLPPPIVVAPILITPERPAPPGEVVYHADTEFLPEERAAIELAMRALFDQTGGMYRPRVVYDVNFWDTASVVRSKNVPTLVRVESTYPWIMAQDFKRGASVMGITFYGGTPSSTFLVIDRLGSAELLQHVTMHELLHAVGLKDLPGATSVMSGKLCDPTGCYPVLCLTPNDADEACRVWRCDPEEMKPCGSSEAPPSKHPAKKPRKIRH